MWGWPMLDLQRWKPARRLRQGMLACLVVLVVALISPAIFLGGAEAQLLPLPAASGGDPLPVNVERQGNLETYDITLDGQTLLRIASPAVLNRAEAGGQMPVEVRATQIEANLRRILPGGTAAAPLDPETLEVFIETLDQYPVLFVRDANQAESRVLLTVTDPDAQYHGVSKEELAVRWQPQLDEALRQAIVVRQPEAQQQQLTRTAKVLGATLALTLVLEVIRRWLGRREQRLHQRAAAESALINVHAPAPKDYAAKPVDPRLWQGLQQHFRLERRLHAVRLMRWILLWGLLSLWALSIAYSLHTFPQTRQFAKTIALAPVVVLLTWFVVGLIDRLIDLAVDQFMQRFARGQSLTSTNLQRINTIAQVIKGVKMVVIYTAGLIWVLQWLNLLPGSVLALGTLLALVLSFAAQNLVKDLVNGFLILIEDQFRIGDVIVVGDIDGFVENLNLRITQLRNPEGQLITLPNSSITQVRNLTRDWSRATLDFEVAYNTDINLALAVVRETADHMAQDPEWQSIILDTNEFFGVQEISHTGILIRIWIKTIPLKQWLVSMEFRRRLKLAFDRQGIQIGAPRQVWLQAETSTPIAQKPFYGVDQGVG